MLQQTRLIRWESKCHSQPHWKPYIALSDVLLLRIAHQRGEVIGRHSLAQIAHSRHTTSTLSRTLSAD